MTAEGAEAHCLSLPGVTLTVQWGRTHVMKVGGKIFALIGGGVWSLAFKASEMAYELLCEEGVARPAPYLARAKWVDLTGPDALGDDDIRAYLTEAHSLVAKKLTRKVRAELGLA